MIISSKVRQSHVTSFDTLHISAGHLWMHSAAHNMYTCVLSVRRRRTGALPVYM